MVPIRPDDIGRVSQVRVARPASAAAAAIATAIAGALKRFVRAPARALREVSLASSCSRQRSPMVNVLQPVFRQGWTIGIAEDYARPRTGGTAEV
jgi:hypothetical protein